MGVDVGSARVGVAVSDPDGLLATPWRTLARDEESGADLDAIVALAAEIEAIELVVGLPRLLSGAEGTAASIARAYARELVLRLAACDRGGDPDRAEGPGPSPQPPDRSPRWTRPGMRLVDERLTTVQAHRRLRESGSAEREHRAVIDQQAAVIVLQTALDAERASGTQPGEAVKVGRARRRQRGAGPAPGSRPGEVDTRG